MQLGGRHRLDQEDGFQIDGGRFGRIPVGAGAVAFFGAQQPIDGADAHRMFAGDEDPVFMMQGFLAVESDMAAFVRQHREGIGIQILRLQREGIPRDVLDMDAKAFIGPQHEILDQRAFVLDPDGLDDAGDGFGPMGVHFEQAVPAFLELFAQTEGEFPAFQEEGFELLRGWRCQGEPAEFGTEFGGDLPAAFQAFLDGVQPLVVPAGDQGLWRADGGRDMDLDDLGLTQAGQPADPLLKDFGRERQIEKDEIAGKLEVAALAANL